MKSDCLRGIPARSNGLLSRLEFHPLVETPPLPQCQVCVIVPVKDEAQLLASTLTALSSQIDLAGSPLDPARYEIILLANNCSDDSAAIARRFANQHPGLVLHIVERTFSATEAYIGWVRKLLMDEAHRRLMSLGRSQGVIASTDGDTQVAPNWIAATLHEIACGADAVGGRIVTDGRDRAALHPYARTCHLREVGYCFLVSELEDYLDPDPFDRWPRHFQHYGASLAVTAAMYAQAGGLPPVRTPEDVAFYRALVRANARFRHSPLVQVTTSARPDGRTQNGLANQLSQWAAMGLQQQPFWVESAAAIETRFQARHAVRLLWQRLLEGDRPTRKDVLVPANLFGVASDWLMHSLIQSANLGALFEQIEHRQKQEGIWQQRWHPVRIEQAIDDLRLLLELLRQQQKHRLYPQVRLQRRALRYEQSSLSHQRDDRLVMTAQKVG